MFNKQINKDTIYIYYLTLKKIFTTKHKILSNIINLKAFF